MLKNTKTYPYYDNKINREIKVECYSTKEEAMARAKRLRDTSTVLGVAEDDWPAAQSYNVTYSYTTREEE